MRALCASLLLFVLSRRHPLPISRSKSSTLNPPPSPARKFHLSCEKASVPLLKLATTSAEGIATFRRAASSGTYPDQVLAPGFAPQTEDVPAHSDVITIQLHLATASETVVVTATELPCPPEKPAPASPLWRTHSSKP